MPWNNLGGSRLPFWMTLGNISPHITELVKQNKHPLRHEKNTTILVLKVYDLEDSSINPKINHQTVSPESYNNTPGKLTWNLKSPNWKWKSSSKLPLLGSIVNSLGRSQKKQLRQQLPGPWPNIAGFMEELMEFTPSRNGSVDPKEVQQWMSIKIELSVYGI